MKRAWAALLFTGCALPVVSAGTFLPAGDLKKGELHASVSIEAGRVLAGPTDVEAKVPPEASPYEVSTWFASDVSLRWQAQRRLSLEGQLKLTNPVVPFTPAIVGGSLGVRLRLREQPPEGGLGVELGIRGVGVAVEEEIQRPAAEPVRVDRWKYRALGVEVPLVATYRVNPLFAVTASPFMRIYWIRAWHVIFQADRETTGATLQWSPVLSAGIGFAGSMLLGPIELAPGVAFELATRPGLDQKVHLLFEPGLSVGTRF
jgi:hypothetical protein